MFYITKKFDYIKKWRLFKEVEIPSLEVLQFIYVKLCLKLNFVFLTLSNNSQLQTKALVTYIIQHSHREQFHCQMNYPFKNAR